MSKVFISFDYEDIESKKVVENWRNQEIGKDISFSSEDGHSYSTRGKQFVQKILREKINEAQVLLVLVGTNTHNRPWVDYEVHHAKCHSKIVLWTQIAGTMGAAPKELIKIAGVPFDMISIQKAIRTI